MGGIPTNSDTAEPFVGTPDEALAATYSYIPTVTNERDRIQAEFNVGFDSGDLQFLTFYSEESYLRWADGDRSDYRALAPEIAARGMAALALDLRGHGGSTNLGEFIPYEVPQSPLIWDAEADVVAAQAYLASLGFGARTFSSGATSNVYLDEGHDPTTVKEALRRADLGIDVYLPEEVPAGYDYAREDRVGDLVLVGRDGTYFRDREGQDRPIGPARLPGMHDFAPDHPDMARAFVMWGPGVEPSRSTVDVMWSVVNSRRQSPRSRSRASTGPTTKRSMSSTTFSLSRTSVSWQASLAAARCRTTTSWPSKASRAAATLAL